MESTDAQSYCALRKITKQQMEIQCNNTETNTVSLNCVGAIMWSTWKTIVSLRTAAETQCIPNNRLIW